MRFGLFFLVASIQIGFIHGIRNCLSGSLSVTDNVITSESYESVSCDGACKKQTFGSSTNNFVRLSCEENPSSSDPVCSSSEHSCVCYTDNCNRVDLETSSIAVTTANVLCYSGFKSSDGLSIGAQVPCYGQCSSFTGVVNGNHFTSYYCSSDSVCNYLNATNTCNTVPGDPDFKVCCCNEPDFCNIANTDIIAPPPQKNQGYSIACTNGVSINGIPVTPFTVTACQGQCTSFLVNSTSEEASYSFVYYGCNPSAVCDNLNMRNSYEGLLPGVVEGCCDTDLCLDPMNNKTLLPNIRKCFVGIYANGKATGTEEYCRGSCTSISTMINDDQVIAFGSAPIEECRSVELYNECGLLPGNSEISMCCCDNYANCNVDLAGLAGKINISSPASNLHEYKISCFSGVFVNNTPVASAGWVSCNGQCSSFTFTTIFNGNQVNTTSYSCSSTSTCNQLGMNNNCTSFESGFTGCCCSTDACIDPTVHPNRTPGSPLKCYIGYKSNYEGLTIGGEEYCDGQCASMSGIISWYNVTSYQCVKDDMCKSLRIKNSCGSLVGDREIEFCCCDNADNCNAKDAKDLGVPHSFTGYDILCKNGLYVNGAAVTPITTDVCQGQCSSTQYSTIFQGEPHVATLYGCSPFCNMITENHCYSVQPGVILCCCDNDNCLDPIKNKTVPAPPLKCVSGVYNDLTGITTGRKVFCDGACTSMTLNDYSTFLGCSPTKYCQQLELYNACDPNYGVCCCDSYDTCNVDMAGLTGKIDNNKLASPIGIVNPITCYSGLFMENQPLSIVGWQSCLGQCLSVSTSSIINGVSINFTSYQCDQSKLCQLYGFSNSCAGIGDKSSLCCCSTDTCLDPTVDPPRTPAKPLTCFVGISSDSLLIGAETYCDGQCGLMKGVIGGSNVTTFHCLQDDVCKSLDNKNTCRVLFNYQLEYCCCNNQDNCNILNTVIIPLPAPISSDYSITCHSGFYVNGSQYIPSKTQTCQGHCTSTSLTMTSMNQQNVAILYGCSPSSVCRKLNATNTCQMVQPGVEECCCDSDLCMNPFKNKTIPSNSRKCFSGVFFNRKAIGSVVDCQGVCTSFLSTANNDPVTVFGCFPPQTCHQLELYDACGSSSNLESCCCDNYDNCNVDLAGLKGQINLTPSSADYPEIPITCYSGVYVNNQPIATSGWQACSGSCVSYNFDQINTTIYTCDTSRSCSSLNLSSNCTTVEPGLSACCCSSNACLDPTVTPPRYPKNPLKCFIGVQSNYGGLNIGSESVCDGQCGSISGTVQGFSVTTYHCFSDSICGTLNADNKCQSSNGLCVCCCSGSDKCNIKNTHDPTSPVLYDTPVGCYSGLVVDGKVQNSMTLQECYGQCASLTTTNFQTHSGTLYTCDSTSLCQNLRLANGCYSLGNGTSACCCRTDGCLNPYTNYWPSSNFCYVGVYSSDNKVNTGATVPCDGYCGSFETVSNGVMFKSYDCVPKETCRSFGVMNQKRTFQSVTGYCCTTGSNCHVTEPAVNTTNVIPTQTSQPISCRSSIFLKGSPITSDGYSVCHGQCVTWTYTFQPNKNFTVHTCDSSSVCSSLKLTDSCSSINGEIIGCCCTTDNCVQPNPSPPSLTSSTSMTSTTLLTSKTPTVTSGSLTSTTAAIPTTTGAGSTIFNCISILFISFCFLVRL